MIYILKGGSVSIFRFKEREEPTVMTLEMEAVGSSEIPVNTSIITLWINPDDKHLNLHCHEALKSHKR
jgi:hypothetical protein